MKKIVRSKFFSLIGFGMAVATLTLSCTGKAEKERSPNFIIIFTDDQGYGDLGCYGSPDIHTPNIDRMAAEGIRLTSFYAAPFCAASRAQLMTGCYPARVGHARNPWPSSSFGLNPDEITLAELLKEQGYATMCIGKWHLGDAPEFLPTRQGFDGYFGIPFSNDMWRYHPRMEPQEDEGSLMRAIRERAAYTGFEGQGTYFLPGRGFPNDLPLMRNEEVIEMNPDQRMLTTRYTEAALKFIEEKKDQPFFLYLAHNMPHVPLFVSRKYDGKSFRGLYGDVMMEIDWSVEKILDRLEELGIDEQTMVIFTSDNGPWLKYGIDGGSAGPLRDGKGSVYEGGVRVPAIFRWPGKISPNRRTGAVAGNLDLLPTLAHLANAPLPADRIIDGCDLWPLLAGDTIKSPRQYFHYMAGSREGRVNYLGIRDDRWKLLVNINDSGKVISRELYDLGLDVSERFNRLDQHPEIAIRLNTAAQQFYNEITSNLRPAGHRNRN
ncbi:MAG: sulfatase-like hydrolase/transferase [Bacteroidetes bacterium]|nr:sulfatase-like hydrolase/transferase [Bacteroidota bacterium]